MANSYIQIEFTAIPAENQTITFNESLNNLNLTETFKLIRSSAYQTQIPGKNSGKYQMTTGATEYIYDYGVSYTAIGGSIVNSPLSSMPMMDNANGTYTFTILAESPITFYNLITKEATIFPDGYFENVGSYYTDFISQMYKSAFDLDYNSNYLFTVEAINGDIGTGLGIVKITANYINAFFTAGTYPFANITIVNDAFTSSINPTEIEFSVEVSSVNVEPKSIEIISNKYWEIIELPNWLSVSASNGNESETIEIKPINFSELSLGEHLFELDFKIGDEHFKVNVTLKVFKTIINPYLPNEFAFTLDPKYFIIKGERTDTYFQFDSTIVINKFFTNEIISRTIPQKALLFKGESKIYLGPLVHRLMDRFESINYSTNQYKLAKLNIVCKEISSDGTIISNINVPEIKFVAGLSIGFTKFGFLEFNTKPTRVTNRGFYFLNILIPSGLYELKTFKNKEFESTIQLPTETDGPICYQVFFDNYTPGDFIEFVISKIGISSENDPRKGFFIFPDQIYSNVIVWENEFLLQSAFEFTHYQDISADIERVTSKTLNGLVEKTTHHSTSKDNKLTINTGWVSLNDIDSIESLLLSKKAFLNMNGKILDLVPISKSLKGINSEQELYDYTFEFTINRTYNEETYSS